MSRVVNPVHNHQPFLGKRTAIKSLTCSFVVILCAAAAMISIGVTSAVAAELAKKK